MNSLVPAAGDGFDVTGSLDDLLPSSAPQDRAQPAAAPAGPPDSDSGPTAGAEAEPVAPEPPRELTPADIAELMTLHDEVNAASAASESLSLTGRGRRRLRAAMQAEDDALRQFGFMSHSDFVFATQAGGYAPPPPEDVWGAPERAAARETLASLNTIDASAAPTPSPEPEPEPDPAPVPDPAPDPVPDAAASELEAARVELARLHEEVQRVEAERDTASAQWRSSDEQEARTRAELEQLAARCRQADAESEEARRKLADAESQLDRMRAELAGAAVATVTDEDALRQIRLESEQELDRIRTLAGREIEELAAKLSAFEDETGRVAAELADNHRQELQRLEADRQAAVDAATQAGAEAVDATRSRDAAIDEIARHHVEIEKLRNELGLARADVTRLEGERDAAMSRVAEAETGLGAAREDSERDFVRLDAVVKQQEAEIAELRAQLGQASTDTNAIALAQAELAKAAEDLDLMRRERAAAREAAELLQSDLESARRDVEIARADAEAASAEADSARAEIDLIRPEISSLETMIHELETRAAEDEPTRELRRLVEVAQDLASGTEPRSRPRVEAEQELADLEARVVDLRTKRRRAKKRLEREQLALRQAEAARERVRQETETLAARIATEAASLLDDALHRRDEAERARQAEIDEATTALAALEAGVETVVVDANTLRSRLAALRAGLGGDAG